MDPDSLEKRNRQKKAVKKLKSSGIGGQAVIEGVIRIGIFVGYVCLITLMDDIKRLFKYHGAEHKSIACYEHGDELTPENAKKYSKNHKK